jgi:hypothetical protein
VVEIEEVAVEVEIVAVAVDQGGNAKIARSRF